MQTQKQQELIRQDEQLNRARIGLDEETKKAEKMRADLVSKQEDLVKKLEKIASLTTDEAREILIKEVQKKSAGQIAKTIKEAEEKAKSESDELAKEILVDAMRAGATDYVAEFTVSTVAIPDEETKGRIIGKDGRNIRVFEKVSGVDISMDETPGEVRLSSFNSVRREIARVALTRLIKDGRIQPARIEEYLDRARQDVERIMFQEGEKLCHAVGVYNLPREIIAMLGKFKFRSSYGQNMIAHTLEETQIGIRLAQEVKANVDTVRLGCLLHDIGKVIDDIEGSHVELGVKFLKKFNLPEAVVDAVEQHHEDREFSSKESVLVYVADAISGSRPGARHENVEDYIKRLNRLEEIANSKEGVQESFAIQAGRELRVVVTPEKVPDEQLPILASTIKDEIQNSLTYPGTVKVTVIRETRASDVAK
ncbi:ribonuclease Y [Candidatus Collierbacteria bacterium RIFCSPLOWO2_01_FULL_50_23]|uniref:Ribonuclease Y n=2 Tax=Candidatus Collieribacteriota TaxID=1752725 RepID=A0A1F5EWP8_9BACT|nr:MAG: ribonuclease Y [Candidatus Collierbacteria bacterium RIFCSPHIGHO2_02_FULL_49_10]OGD72201.1 MAG: ribonuclease Y [Candidatus Collierbacteria bacterium RIFCSPHIGHO2_01_FULL_50_25]OGD74155.1 MAG: ribonuclease Y [Candidatus Collierbacteria bacterium RIFCSPLOWO2_01_FULL_50_23]